MKTEKQKRTSDVNAKKAYVKFLGEKGYSNARVVSRPADIMAEKDGEKWFFEIKKTAKDDGKYFGAATMTEWKQAFLDPEHFRFIIAVEDLNGDFTFVEYTPAELMEYSTIPPFKINFNIDLNDRESRTHHRTAVRLTEENLRKLTEIYSEL